MKYKVEYHIGRSNKKSRTFESKEARDKFIAKVKADGGKIDSTSSY